LKFRMTTDTSQIMRSNLAINNNDAEACYNCIIPAINGIAHMAKGMPCNAINMQSNILLNMKYAVTQDNIEKMGKISYVHDQKRYRKT